MSDRICIYITSKKEVIVAQVLCDVGHVVTYNLDGTEKSKSCPEGGCGNAHEGFWALALQDDSVKELLNGGGADSAATDVMGAEQGIHLSDL